MAPIESEWTDLNDKLLEMPTDLNESPNISYSSCNLAKSQTFVLFMLSNGKDYLLSAK